MDQHPHPAPPAPTAPTPADPVRWTPEKQRLFLTGLLATGNVTQAARAAGMSPASAHRLRRRLASAPFDRTWAKALALHAQSLADALHGNDARPVTRQARR
ncbi:LysR family transcriptional regulator [Sphingobium sp. AR-3-1]|uniref:LysR family transcriptional regulator n=1 Tax=Sphingobium psychrophilum TaxID=2728834 RepID=A0A7X9WS13_9SPHN|nr:LysR family transcriptional regulator [Sphingobium psychrophilum]NML08851.1 LysR family transcriptional regulator [Sphingobium psychrophilum]